MSLITVVVKPIAFPDEHAPLVLDLALAIFLDPRAFLLGDAFAVAGVLIEPVRDAFVDHGVISTTKPLGVLLGRFIGFGSDLRIGIVQVRRKFSGPQCVEDLRWQMRCIGHR